MQRVFHSIRFKVNKGSGCGGNPFFILNAETYTFHSFFHGIVVDVNSRNGGNATLEIYSHGFHTWNRADGFFRVGATVVTTHAFHNIGFRGFLLTGGMGIMSVMITIPVAMVMFVTVTMAVLATATACGFVHQPHAEDVKKQEGENAGAEPFEPAGYIVTACMGVVQIVGEPCAGHKMVNADAEENGTADDSREIKQERLLA